MNFFKLILLIFFLVSSPAIAKQGSPVTHKHGSRTHIHPLPVEGKNHSHNKNKAKPSSGWSSFDKGMMGISNSISSIDPVTGKREINLVSEKDEIVKATSYKNKILIDAKKKGLKVDRQTKHYYRVKKIFDKLVKVSHRRNLPWEVHVVEDKEFNAFTLGGGKVFINTGLIDNSFGVKTDHELAAVLAHEIAHVTARHASEKQGKLLISGLVDKKLRNKTFQASFSTNQEDQADKFSVMYSALAGYDPTASVAVWQRMHNAYGSSPGSLNYTHPLNNARARNLIKYSNLARQYYSPNRINRNHLSLLKNNAVFSTRKKSTAKAGQGGGFLALLETTSNAYVEATNAKIEKLKREGNQREREHKEKMASLQLLFKQLQTRKTGTGVMNLYGYAKNATRQPIKEAVVSVKYWSGAKIIYNDKIRWPAMRAYEQRQFAFALKPIRAATRVTINPTYIRF